MRNLTAGTRVRVDGPGFNYEGTIIGPGRLLGTYKIKVDAEFVDEMSAGYPIYPTMQDSERIVHTIETVTR